MIEQNDGEWKPIGDTPKNIVLRPLNDTIPKKMVGIYGLRNKTNGKWYVGQSTDIEYRWGDYDKLRCKTQRKLYRALLKYGINNFEKIIIEKCDNVEWILHYREMYWIHFINSMTNGYNLTEGGQGGKKSEETKKLMSIVATGKKRLPFSDEWKNNMRKSIIGRKHSEETKEKIRQSRFGRSPSKETREKLRNALFGQNVRINVRIRKLSMRSRHPNKMSG